MAKGLWQPLFRRAKRPPELSPLAVHLRQILETYRVDMVIDVGANEGQFGRLLRGLDYEGIIHSFEPLSSAFAALGKAAQNDPCWHVHNVALGDAKGELTLHVGASSDFSSLLPASAFGAAHFKGLSPRGQQTVAVHRLEDYGQGLPDFAGQRVLLKLDTQGYDYQVFAGAAGLRPRLVALLSELSFQPIYEGMKPYLEMLLHYTRQGFAVSGVFPVSRDKETEALIEADCVLVDVARLKN